MTINELKRALMDECPVMLGGLTYKKVTAVIYRKAADGTGLHVQGELLDRNGRAVAIAPPERINFAEDTQ